MKSLLRLFTYKKVATIYIECAIPYEGTVIQFVQKCHLYENKYRDRKCSLSLDHYPLVSIRNKNLIERFLAHQCAPDIPSYEKIKGGLPRAILHDVASFYWG